MAPGFWGFHTQIAGMGDAKGTALGKGRTWDLGYGTNNEIFFLGT